MTKFIDDIRSRNPPVVLLLDVGCNAGDLTISFYDLLVDRLSTPSSFAPLEEERSESGGKRKPERDDPLPKKIRKCESNGEIEGGNAKEEKQEETNRKGPEVAIMGIDIDPELIERAKKKVFLPSCFYLLATTIIFLGKLLGESSPLFP